MQNSAPTTTIQPDHTQADQPHSSPSTTHRERLLTPAFILSWLINVSMYLVFYLLITVMSLYAVQRFATSDAAGGFAASSFVVGATVARIFSGYFVDTFGGRKIMLGSLAFIVATCAAYMWSNSLPMLITVRILHGLTYALASTAVMAAAQTAIPSSRRAEGTGYISLGTTLATAIGPALGLAIIGQFGYSLLFETSLALAVIGLILGFFLRTSAPSASGHSEGNSKASRRFSLSDIVTPTVVPIGLFMLFIGICYAGVITFLNRYSQLNGLTTGAGLFFVAYAVAMISARFFLGRLQDHRGDNPVIGIGLVCFTLSLMTLSAASANWHVVLAGALCGLGFGTLMPACQTIAVHLAPAHKLGTGISTLLLLADAGIGIGPIFLGGVASSIGFGPMYASLAAVVVFAGIFYLFIHGRKPASKRHHVNMK